MREFWLKNEAGRLPEVKRSGIMFSQDDGANRIGVEMPEDIAGTILANIVLANGTTIQETGEKSGKRAWVDLPAAAYAVVGPVGVFLKAVNGTVVATLCGVEAYVVKSR